MRLLFLRLRQPGIVALLLCLAAPVLADSGCLTAKCHQGVMPEANPHYFDGACESCHQRVSGPHPAATPGGKSFTLIAAGAKLCQECHDPFGRKKVVHAPVQEEECGQCHDVHGSGKSLLVPAGEDLTALCTGCHDKAPFEQGMVHGPVAVGSCTECHNPHEADRKGLLKGMTRDLCVRCHTDLGEGLAKAPVIHQAIKEQECTACHDPHSSPNQQLTRVKMPDLCTECHPKVGETAKNAKVPHAPLRRPEGCSSCHATHFSQAPKLLPTGEKELCLSCHGKDDTTRSRALRNIAKEIKDKKFLHGPLQDGSCSACHSPHGSSFFRLLTQNYPSSVYAPYQADTYAFCLQCHDPLMLRYPDTTIYTNFRNGNENLHYLHVVDSRKGRTCRTCHQAHASNLPKLISESGSEFGDWRIPIRFSQTATGGSCAPGCHRVMEYDREKPKSYQRTSP